MKQIFYYFALADFEVWFSLIKYVFFFKIEIKVLSKEEKLRQKKQELNQIKKRYGLKVGITCHLFFYKFLLEALMQLKTRNVVQHICPPDLDL